MFLDLPKAASIRVRRRSSPYALSSSATQAADPRGQPPGVFWGRGGGAYSLGADK